MSRGKAVKIPTIKEPQCRLLFENLIKQQADEYKSKQFVLGITLNVLTSTFCNKINCNVYENIESKASIIASISSDTNISMRRDLIVDNLLYNSAKIKKN